MAALGTKFSLALTVNSVSLLGQPMLLKFLHSKTNFQSCVVGLLAKPFITSK